MSFMGDVLATVLANPGSDLTTITRALKLDPDNANDRHRVSRILGRLVDHKKLQRSGSRMLSRWRACPGVTTDRKKPGPAPKSLSQLKPASPRAKAVRAATAPATAVAVPSPRNAPLPPKPPADCPSRASLIRAFQAIPKVRGSLTREDIAADLEAFIAKGGRIQRLDPGAASKPLRTFIADGALTAVNERTWRERQRRQRDTLDLQDAADLDDAA